VIIGTDDDRNMDDITATASSTTDISVRREPIESVKLRALFVIRSLTGKPGMFQIKFEMPCGKRDMIVKVR